MPWLSTTWSIPRRTMAVACAVRRAARPATSTVKREVPTPALGQRSATPVIAATSRAVPARSAAATPNIVGRRCVLMRSRLLPAP